MQKTVNTENAVSRKTIIIISHFKNFPPLEMKLVFIFPFSLKQKQNKTPL